MSACFNTYTQAGEMPVFTAQSHCYLLLPVSKTGLLVGVDPCHCPGHCARFGCCPLKSDLLTKLSFILLSTVEYSIAEKVVHFKRSHMPVAELNLKGKKEEERK